MKQNVNVLLIVCDQFRGDALSFANHPDVKTPYLDSLAADGVFFSHAYSATPSCIPARAALMTGRSQKRHGRVGYLDEVSGVISIIWLRNFQTAAIRRSA